MLVFSCFVISSTVTLLLWTISSIALFFVLCDCGWMARALCINHTCMAISKYFNPLIHNSTRERALSPILSTHALMNLSTWCTFWPQKTLSQIVAPPWCNSQVSLACPPLRSNSHTNCKVNRLALPTSHMAPYYPPPPPTLSICFEHVKVRKLFEDPSYISCNMYITKKPPEWNTGWKNPELILASPKPFYLIARNKGRRFLFLPFRAWGYTALYSKLRFIKCAAALPQNNTDPRSLAALKPGVFLSDFKMNVLFLRARTVEFA
jgi:hypothetical protein